MTSVPPVARTMRTRLMTTAETAAVTQVIAAEPVAVPLWRRFRAVLVLDSTTSTLPAALAPTWPAGRAQTPTAPAGVKLQVRWDLGTGQLTGPVLTPARTKDRRATRQLPPRACGGLVAGGFGLLLPGHAAHARSTWPACAGPTGPS